MHHGDALQRTNATEAPRFHRCSKSTAGLSSTPSLTFARRNFRKPRPLRGPEPWVKQLRVLPVQAAGLPDSKTEQPPPIGRAVAAVLIVSAVGAAATFIVGLISSPLMEWSSHLPELGARLKEKLHVFDRPLALWQQLQGLLGGSDGFSAAPFQMPKFDWVQPTIEFLSPTFTEFLLFFATLILFIASWRDLRRALVLTFADHAARLRTLRILNEIE